MGWTPLADTTGTIVYTVTLRGAPCQVVTPALPTPTQAVCSGGAVSDPTLTLPSTTGVTYTAEPGGPYAPGQSVTVTATLDPAGVGWPATMPIGVEPQIGDHRDLRPHVPPCVSSAGRSGGPAGGPSDVHQRRSRRLPSVTAPETTGVTYVVEPADLGDGTDDVEVTVTATVDDGYGWERSPVTACE